ncbi:MAG: hypothetical protein L0Z48_04740 [candidate division Zixibacteria bacterium]|nr:hypothetical protein [candidate division Zixibacteria bacterium]MCI0595833.1 hypothetical protein [candidate division Zixibacteria bacterium]
MKAPNLSPPPSGPGFWEKFALLDRRIIFGFVFLAIALPMFFTLRQPIPVSPEGRAYYESIEKLPAGSKILLSFDFDPPSSPELQPMAEATFKQLFTKNCKLVVIGLWPQGPQQAEKALASALRDPRFTDKKLEYGMDYANLGFMAGNEVVIQKMNSDIPSTFPADYKGNATVSLPIMKGVKNYKNFDFIINFSSGYPGTREWVQFCVDRSGSKMIAGNTAVQAPENYQYFRSGQLKGLLAGMKGAAEYETVSNQPGKGVSFMGAQSVSHLIVMLFVILGNIAFFVARRKR